MKFSGIVWKNFKFGIRKYIAFFLCSTFTISIFFIFCNLSFSKEINDFMNRAGMGSEYVFSIMVIILSIFSVGFISYINSSKNKSRSKEFGLYMTMGMTYRDISRLIILEDLVILAASIVLGIAVGTVFSRLVYMINMKIIGEENGRFVLDYRSYLLTAAIFIVIYGVNIFITILSRRKMNIKRLMTSDRESEFTARSHSGLAAAGLVLMAVFASTSVSAAMSRDIAMKRIPIILAIIAGMAGMYLVISHITGILSAFVKGNRELYGRSLLNLSELKYTSKKNANVLFLLSILSGMILLCSASTFALLSISEKIVERTPEQVITYIEAFGVNRFEEGYADELVRESGAGLREHFRYPCTFANKIESVPASPADKGASQSPAVPVCIISRSTLHIMTGDQLAIGSGEAQILAADPLAVPSESSLKEIEITNGVITKKLLMKGTVTNHNFSSEIVLGNRYILVVADENYRELESSNKEFNGIIHDIRVDKWKKTGPVFDRLNGIRDNSNPLSQHFTVFGDYAGYTLMRHLYSNFVFVTNFISILFFASSILILLFRQYESTDKMAKKYSQLRKIGVMRKEFRKFIHTQTGFLFIIPLILGLFMGACLMLIIQSIMGGNDLYKEFWSASAKIAAVYIVLQLIFSRAVSENYYKGIINKASIK
ncbi:ABC transporter permease [Ruminiclostridium cellobioparum]|uniref:Putative permease n=1 Tax=Ruminiclostridium cellobioparum subsp. termitidis CT1112 TaxID=1195236 RepID=S0FMK1_RUMCE|nr:ABC transporter permease [Ruminiclostridium cellobioparum]EMS69723.1 putative permease [Ruminiclostridium cellobioparum subsp. termitidis CT1112]